jgi:ribose transport system substrate-binding protein
MKRSTHCVIAGGIAATLLAGSAVAQDFHGFSPTGFSGQMLSADQLRAAVAEAMEKTPPRNGE